MCTPSKARTLGRRVRSLLALCFVSIAAAGCNPKSGESAELAKLSESDLPIVRALPLGKSGTTITLDFVLPAKAGAKSDEKTARSFFIGFRILLTPDLFDGNFQTVDHLVSRADMPVRVVLQKTDTTPATPIRLTEYMFSPEPGPPPSRVLIDDIAVTKHRTSADPELLFKKGLSDSKLTYFEYEFAHVTDPQAGSYRLSIETLKDSVDLQALATEIIVTNYYQGK